MGIRYRGRNEAFKSRTDYLNFEVDVMIMNVDSSLIINLLLTTICLSVVAWEEEGENQKTEKGVVKGGKSITKFANA